MTVDAPAADNDEFAHLEKVLAQAMVDLAGELRLIDAIDLLNEQANRRTANIADIVNSAAELFFREGTVLARSDETSGLHWRRTGSIDLNLIFRSTGVEAHFDLSLARDRNRVSLCRLHYQPPTHCQETKLLRLRDALQSARLDQPFNLLREAHHMAVPSFGQTGEA